MKNIPIYCFLIAFLFTNNAFSQKIDSLNFLSVAWKKTDLGNGLTAQHYQFKDKTLFNANQNIHFVTSKRAKRKDRRRSIVAFVSDGDSLALTSILAKNSQALAAVNGSFFDTKNGGAVDFIKIDGQILDTTRHNNKRLAEHQMSALVIKDNQISIAKARDSVDFQWDTRINAPNVMVTGPLLIFDGQRYPLSKSAFTTNRHPRTAACVTHKNDLILLTADGRTAEAQGLNLNELTTLLLLLDCKSAVNLDGGGSTTLYLQDKGVVNMPCDNKKFDHEGERKVSNIVLLKLKTKKL